MPWIAWIPGRVGTKKVLGTRYYDLTENHRDDEPIRIGTNGKWDLHSVIT